MRPMRHDECRRNMMKPSDSRLANSPRGRRAARMAFSRHRSRNFAGEATLYLLLVGILVCLFPLALYCLFLAWLHQRPQPTLMPGRWDFVGVLVALSGF